MISYGLPFFFKIIQEPHISPIPVFLKNAEKEWYHCVRTSYQTT